MVASLFDKITRASLKLWWLTIILAVAALVLGGVAVAQLNQELLPPIEFPAMVAITFWSGADADDVLEQVTIPLEDAVQGHRGCRQRREQHRPGLFGHQPAHRVRPGPGGVQTGGRPTP